MKNENYITIQGWMVSQLKLSGNELICYALIYGFTQDEESEFKGSLSYVAEWLNVSKGNARLILKKLVDKGHVIKRDEVINNVRFCRYKASLNGMVKTDTGVAVLTTGGIAVLATNNTNNDKIDDKINKKEDTNVSSKNDENWRTSFAIYKSLVDEAKLKLINNRDYQAYIESYYPNSDYVKSINKMVEGFWGIEEGWEFCKKKRKGKNIDMYAALKRNLDSRNRIVYNSISTFPSKQTYNPKNEGSKPLVPLHPELTYVDNEGTLSDGTFMKNGYRYYFSNRQGESFSVPPGEEPKPNGDNWEYAYGTGWYENVE